MNCLSFLILFCVYPEIYTWKTFFRGRSVGGNLGLPPGVEDEETKLVSEEWFTQNLDHFDPINNATWKQRYFVNDQYYDQSGGSSNVFLMIGGEGKASAAWMVRGSWIDYAKRFSALCFQLEHRYYGESHPTEDLSVENLHYLTSQQALADLATFITAMNEKYQLPSNTKWIAFGGSYPGSLAAWLRLKYPHLVHGAMSASGPLLAEIDFSEYFKVVVEALRTNSNECVTAIKQGTAQIELLLRKTLGQHNLNQLFKLCDPVEDSINNDKDISNLFETLSGNFADIVQYNKDNRFGSSATKNITIDTLCNIMTNQTLGTPITRLAKVNDLIMNATGEKCVDYKYQNMINSLSNVSWESTVAEGGRQWTYQTCTEFGFYQTSDYKPQIFSDRFPVDFYIQQCIDIFGDKFNGHFLENAIARTNTLYGALDIEVTNVVFVHGSIDPWHALGIIKTINQGAPAIYIKGTAHCANMYPKSNDDLPQLSQAREEIGELIDTWIRL